MADVVYSDMSYCSLCDRYFLSDEERAEHVQMSTNHPRCRRCDRRFANKNSLRNHWVYSRRHHYCAVCEKDFKSAGGLRVHIEMAAVHRDDSDDEDEEDDDIDDTFHGWEDALARHMYPDEGNVEPPASDNEEYGPGDEYWDEDDETEFEEEREAYFGFASVGALGGDTLPANNGADAQSTGTVSVRSNSSSSSSSSASSAPQPSSSKMVHQKDTSASQATSAYGCALCLEAPQNPSATRCGHIFCTQCINTALEQKRMCPVCRNFACSKQLRQIFLPVLS